LSGCCADAGPLSFGCFLCRGRAALAVVARVFRALVGGGLCRVWLPWQQYISSRVAPEPPQVVVGDRPSEWPHVRHLTTRSIAPLGGGKEGWPGTVVRGQGCPVPCLGGGGRRPGRAFPDYQTKTLPFKVVQPADPGPQRRPTRPPSHESQGCGAFRLPGDFRTPASRAASLPARALVPPGRTAMRPCSWDSNLGPLAQASGARRGARDLL